MPTMTPSFPITIEWIKSREVERFDSMEELECNLENFCSGQGEAIATDANGKRVRLRIDLLSVSIFELEQPN